jgi:inositol phosphorylceramide mannosyltransferase catalytic subunit
MVKNKRLLTLLCICITGCSLYYFSSRPSWGEKHFISFQQSMSKSHPEWPQKKFKRLFLRKQDWAFVKSLYEKHALQAKSSEKTRIPKIIHQIWLGSPLPEKYKALQKSWIDHHPDWEYRLWTDESLKDFKLHNQALYDSAVNWGEKADILRYEILYRYGGLYVDTDFECVRAFDILHQQFDFYSGLFNVERTSMSPRIGNGLIACIPGHPILKECMCMSGEGPRDNCDMIQLRTGPGHFTACFLKHAKEGQLKNVAFPFTYFYPLPATKREEITCFEEKEKWLYDETFAIHYWEASWVK